MNPRLETSLYRWSSRLAVSGVVLAVISVLTDWFISTHIYTFSSLEYRPKTIDRTVVLDSLRTVLAEATHIISALDGNPQTQKDLSTLIAQKDTNFVRELWVVDTSGNVVYSGRHKPILPKVEVLIHQPILGVLEGISPELLPTRQRLAIALAFAIQCSYRLAPDILKETPPRAIEWRDFDYDHQTPTERMVEVLTSMRGPANLMSSDHCIALQPIQEGMMAAVGRTTIWPPYDSSFLLAAKRGSQWNRITTISFVTGFLLYWLALPLWVAIDARRRQEKATAWTLFILLGNIVALVLYLLVRREVPRQEKVESIL